MKLISNISRYKMLWVIRHTRWNELTSNDFQQCNEVR
jgi:hypothetical protein